MINFMINKQETEKIAKEICVKTKIKDVVVNYKVFATNNAFDNSPVWEEITENFKNNIKYNFINRNYEENKSPGICVKFSLEGPEDFNSSKIRYIAVGYN